MGGNLHVTMLEKVWPRVLAYVVKYKMLALCFESGKYEISDCSARWDHTLLRDFRRCFRRAQFLECSALGDYTLFC